ncbi:MAG: gliding motility-associated C-terminal domain-containing protein [Bacteroidota bacterium]
MKKIILPILGLFLVVFVKAQGADCSSSDPFCTGTSYNFPASVGVPNLGQIGCLYTSPNPAWYFMQVSTSGNIDIHMSSADVSGSGHDVDFICWGPFTSLSAACASNLLANSGVDCSFSAAAQEDCNIPGAQAGEIYVLLITNYSNAVTNISFNQTGGTGATDCGILAPPITGDIVCVGETIQLTVNSPTVGATYHWTGPGGWSSNTMNPTRTGATTAMSGTYSMTITVGGQTSPPVTCTVTVNPNPIITITPANPTTCSGTPITLTGNSNTVGTTTYHWSNNTNGPTLTVSPTTPTTYSVTGTDQNGCTGTASIAVTISPTLTITVNPAAPFTCAGVPVSLTANGATTYVWTPAATLSSGSGSTVTATPLTTTIYTVNGSSAGGCTGSTTVMVTVNPNLLITPTATPAAICNGASSTLTANCSVPGATFAWIPGSLSGSPLTVTPSATTTYTVAGTAAGCTGSATVTLTVNPIPTVTTTTTPSTICNGASSSIIANSNVPGTQFAWMPGSITGSPITVAPSTTTTYSVLGTAAGCTGSSTVTLTVNPNPVISSTAFPTAVCNGVPSSLTSTSDVAGTTFQWMPGNLTGTPVSVTPATTTTYTITGTASGCTGNSVVTVNVSYTPIISIIATPDHVCPGDTSTLTCTGNAQNYTWFPTVSISNITGQSTNAYPSSTTTYSVTADNNGCSSSANYTLVVSPLPTVDFTSDIREGCQGLTIHFQDLTTPAVDQWYWNFGDTHISYGNNSYLQNPTHYYGGAGTYDVSLSVVTVDGCKMGITYPGYIITHPIPSADFSVTPDIVNELNALVFFFDQSVGASTWNYYFGELNAMENNSTLPNPTHIYSDTGMFYPSLVVFSDYGCSDTAFRSVYVEPNFAFYVPNAFTPNDDGKNQNFIPKGEGIILETFKMRVYDRWGRQVCYTEDMESGWDGKVAGGKTSEQGVYSWYISFYDVNHKYHSYKGNVTLVR